MKKLIHCLMRLYTFFAHPSTLFYYKNFKGTILYPGVVLKGSKYFKILNSKFSRKCSIKAFNIDKNNKKPLIDISNSYFGDYAYISSSGNLCIQDASFAPYVFIGSYKHSLTKEADSSYHISIYKPKFIGQNVSIFGNITIGENAVVGACSVVTKDVLPNSMVVGNPAKKIKEYNPNSDKWVRV